MSEQWYFGRNGQQGGPVSSADLKQLAASGRLSPEDLLWKEGMPEWVPAAKLQGLQFAPSPPPLPPPGFNAAPRPNRIPGVPQSAGPFPGPPNRGPSPGSFPYSDDDDSPFPVEGASTFRPRSSGYMPRRGGGFDRQRLAIVIAAAIGMLGSFLPWVQSPFGGISGIDGGDGWIILGLFVPAVVLAFIGDKSNSLTGGMCLGAVIPAGFAGALSLFKIVKFTSDMSGIPNDNPFAKAIASSISLGPGLFFCAIAAVVLCVLAYTLATPERRRYGH